MSTAPRVGKDGAWRLEQDTGYRDAETQVRDSREDDDDEAKSVRHYMRSISLRAQIYIDTVNCAARSRHGESRVRRHEENCSPAVPLQLQQG